MVDTSTTDYLVINLLFSEEYCLILRRFTDIKKKRYIKLKRKEVGAVL